MEPIEEELYFIVCSGCQRVYVWTPDDEQALRERPFLPCGCGWEFLGPDQSIPYGRDDLESEALHDLLVLDRPAFATAEEVWLADLYDNM